MAQMVKNLPAMQETWIQSTWKREWLPTPVLLNSMDTGDWHAIIHGVAELDTTEQLPVSVYSHHRTERK